MSKTDDGGPAFPGYTMEDDGEKVNVTKLSPGMTLLDYMAAAALQGILANPSWNAFTLQAGVGLSERESILAAGRMAYLYASSAIHARPKE
jgi:hypothetical protein